MNENLSPAPLPSIPIDYETQRLRVLHSYNILDTPVEQEFDDIASLAAQICGTPIALISLVDEFKQWFKARLGMNAVETPRELSFCAHALRQTEPLVVQDATRDPRFAGNLLVTEEPFIRFYAGAPLVAPSGEVLGTLCVIDHTERTLTPEQLRALTLLAREVMTHLELRRSLNILQSSEARYRQLFEQHPHPMWVNDRETRRFLAVNDAAVAHYGYSREEFLAMTSDEINHDDGSGRVQHRAKDGSVLAVEITSNPMDFDGSKAAVVLAVDVTSRLAAETVLRNSETLQREAAESQAAILNALPADIALLDAHGFILAVNDSWQQFTSATAAHGQDDFVGQNYLGVCAAASVDGSPEAAQITCGLRAVLAGELPSYSMEYACHSLTEQRWFRLVATPLDEHPGSGEAVVMHIDITERKLAEIALEKTNLELREVSRLAGMADVATSVLHNVGNVLNSVHVSCSLASEKVRKSRISSVAHVSALLQENQADLVGFVAADPRGLGLPEYLAKLARRLAEEQAELLAEIHSLARNLDHIKEVISIQQHHAKSRVVIRERVALGQLVDDALQMSGVSLMRHGIELIRDFREMPPTPMERHKVLQILVNLLCNAKQAILAKTPTTSGQITVRIWSGDGQVAVSVSDNGIGIAPENLVRIFAQGFTTKKLGHGFGLHSGALAVQEMGGSLFVNSDGLGKGATFTLTLLTAETGELAGFSS